MLGGRQCAGAKVGSLNISPATHVEASVDGFEDRGSTPLASSSLCFRKSGRRPAGHSGALPGQSAAGAAILLGIITMARPLLIEIIVRVKPISPATMKKTLLLASLLLAFASSSSFAD